MKFLYSNGDKQETLKSIRSLQPVSLLDIGSVDDPWTGEFVTATVDLRESHLDKTHFRGNLNDCNLWKQILDYVDTHGKFAFSVCSHVLEDIAYPALALEMLPLVSEAGLIATPSHMRELTRGIEGPWRGYIHHRWILREYNRLLLIPKMPFLEHSELIFYCPNEMAELQLWWKKEIDFQVFNNDYLGPNPTVLKEKYDEVLR